MLKSGAVKEKAAAAGRAIGDKAAELKYTAIAIKEDISDKITELDRMLEASVTEYNDAFTLMNDKGLQLFVERSRSVDLIDLVEGLVNSIANRPKAFDREFDEIHENRARFVGACEFGVRELQAARAAAGGAGAGLAAGASVAFLAPSAAMWVATTFGTASTGTAISTLTGAAATNAALAWLGGGALSVGGGGMAAGHALLALAGPIGWSIAGATLLTSILLFSSKKKKLNRQKNEEIESVKENTERVRELDAGIGQLLSETSVLRDGLNGAYTGCLALFGGNYADFTEEQRLRLGTLVNHTKSLSSLLGKIVG